MRRRRFAAALLIGAALVIGVVLACGERDERQHPSRLSSLGMVLLREDAGLYVLGVSEDSPASEAGILPGDYLITAGGAALSSADQLAELMDGRGGELEVSVRRQDGTVVLELKGD